MRREAKRRGIGSDRVRDTRSFASSATGVTGSRRVLMLARGVLADSKAAKTAALRRSYVPRFGSPLLKTHVKSKTLPFMWLPCWSSWARAKDKQTAGAPSNGCERHLLAADNA